MTDDDSTDTKGISGCTSAQTLHLIKHIPLETFRFTTIINVPPKFTTPLNIQIPI